MIVIYIYYFDNKLNKICAFYLKFKPGEKVWIYNVEINNPVKHKKLGRSYYIYHLKEYESSKLRMGYTLKAYQKEDQIKELVDIISELHLKPQQYYVSYSWFKV